MSWGDSRPRCYHIFFMYARMTRIICAKVRIMFQSKKLIFDFFDNFAKKWSKG